MIMKSVFRLSYIVPVIIAVVIVFALFADGSEEQPASARSSDHSAGNTSADAGYTAAPQKSPSVMVAGAAELSVPAQRPSSLEGTSEPGGWAITDRLGNLVPTGELRQLFEYYLSALGEETLVQLVARIRLALSLLEEPARAQAFDTLGRYLDYKLALADLEAAYGETGAGGPEEIQRRMAEIQALRRTWLDADTAEAFFSDEEAIDRYQLARLGIGMDGGLSEQQRNEALAKAEMALPESVRQARQDTRKFARYEQVRESLGSDPEALRAWRQQEFGEEAAQRLEELSAEQEDWNRRWQSYAKERDTLNVSGLAEPEREQGLALLREKYFSETERIRAQALDSVQ
ncbi:lipase secretion chaperone [Marinobacter sp. 1_MG-2023]|uniref:lipase secretion chaperone n=1 Tax=Marinobacter sp. 1_MG-2023 TaxID=3062627 RepID=UPI0026E475B3|nr:lipase secretion chaperone [Marinobacter sp. 1_MG-2023]MDO6822378.1 lipase secretion chaperone [Marinobacter sp. 1_MG-2023]